MAQLVGEWMSIETHKGGDYNLINKKIEELRPSLVVATSTIWYPAYTFASRFNIPTVGILMQVSILLLTLHPDLRHGIAQTSCSLQNWLLTAERLPPMFDVENVEIPKEHYPAVWQQVRRSDVHAPHTIVERFFVLSWLDR